MYKIMINLILVSISLMMFSVNSGVSQSKITKTMTSNGKPGAPVELTYQIPANIVVGGVVSVNLSLRSETSEGRLGVQLSVDEGLEYLEAFDAADFDLAIDQMNIDVRVLPEADGLYYLNVHAQEFSTLGEVRRSRAFSVPIQVGSTTKNLKRTGEIVEDKEEKIIEMIAN